MRSHSLATDCAAAVPSSSSRRGARAYAATRRREAGVRCCWPRRGPKGTFATVGHFPIHPPRFAKSTGLPGWGCWSGAEGPVGWDPFGDGTTRTIPPFFPRGWHREDPRTDRPREWRTSSRSSCSPPAAPHPSAPRFKSAATPAPQQGSRTRQDCFIWAGRSCSRLGSDVGARIGFRLCRASRRPYRRHRIRWPRVPVHCRTPLSRNRFVHLARSPTRTGRTVDSSFAAATLVATPGNAAHGLETVIDGLRCAAPIN